MSELGRGGAFVGALDGVDERPAGVDGRSGGVPGRAAAGVIGRWIGIPIGGVLAGCGVDERAPITGDDGR